MPIRKRVKPALEKAVFKRGGRYFQRKAAIEEGKRNSLKHQRILSAAEKAYARGIAKAETLRGAEKIRFLETLENKLYSGGIMPTYEPQRAKKKEAQSPAHNKISSMTADVRMRIIRAQNAAKRR